MWREISDRPRFAYCPDSMYCNNKVYMLACDSAEDLQYLCGVLNSRIVRWYGRHVTVTTGAGEYSWFKFSVESIPVPVPSRSARWDLAEFVVHSSTGIRNASSPQTDTGAALLQRQSQRKANELVTGLYGLTAEDQALLELRLD